MSFSIPKNVPNFRDPYRNLEDKAWAAVRGGAGYQELPMYKDKPQFASSRRRKSFWKRKRLWLLTAVTIWFLWVRGWLPGSQKTTTSASRWSWQGLSGAGAVNWDHRREQVVEAFQLTWDSYERYGWGTYQSCDSRSITNSLQAMTSTIRFRRQEKIWLLKALVGLLSMR